MSFSDTLTIGRQHLWSNADVIESSLREAGMPVGPAAAAAIVRDGGGFSEEFFRFLGASAVDSLDVSDYEGCSIVHDLNDPLPQELRERFSVVLDVGTLEHIFDFPRALESCLSAVAVGGHFITITPANNELGHGFYQFSPELYFRVLSPVNGFEVTCVLLRSNRRAARWYAVEDPASLGRRVTLSGAFPSYMYVVGRKVGRQGLFETHPQQSDYVATWGNDQRRLVPRVPRVPAVPIPVRQALDWQRLAIGLPTRSGLKAVRLSELGETTGTTAAR